MKIGTKILLVVLVTSLGALLLVGSISYGAMLNLTKYTQDANIGLGITSSEESEQALLEQAKDYLEKVAVRQAKDSNSVLAQVETEVASMATYISFLYSDAGSFQGQVPLLPYQTISGVYSPKYMLAPGVEETNDVMDEVKLISNGKYMFSTIIEHDETLDNVYLGTASGISYRYSASNAYNPDYDPRERAWYLQAINEPSQPHWVDTYLDAYGEICVTCAAAFTDKEGNPVGVLGVDITLNKLKEDILATHIGDDGYAFLLDATGAYIAHPNYDMEGFNTNPISVATGSWLETLQAMTSGSSGVEETEIDGIESYVAYATLENTGWSLGLTVPIEEIIEPAEMTKEKIEGYTQESQDYIEKTLSDILMIFILLFSISMMILVLLSFVLSHSIRKPIQGMIQSIEAFSKGDMTAIVNVKSKDEIGQLSRILSEFETKIKERESIYKKDKD